MKKEYFIDIVLDAQFDESNIYTILESGHKKGFKYLSYMKNFKQVLNTKEAAEEIILGTQVDDLPSVFTILNAEVPKDDVPANVTISFHKDASDNLEFHIGVFGGDYIKKEDMVDLSFYVPFFISLCKDFTILKVKADFFEDY